jgi:hypothetical protein
MISGCTIIPGVLDTTSSPATRGCYLTSSSFTGFGIAWNSTTVSDAFWMVMRVR